MTIFELIATEHPAFIHVPLGLALTVPLALAAGWRSRDPGGYQRTALFLAAVALLGSLLAIPSGLLWSRQINLVPPGAFLPKAGPSGQALPSLLLRHEVLAVLGVGAGVATLALVWLALRRPWLRSAALVSSLVWAGAWGATGRMGGVMVFGNEATNRAAAEADAARKADAEADLPVRALDYASLEPASARPFLAKAHGGHWGRVWVTASGIDAYQAGQPLPPGAYAVMSTFLDSRGRPGFEPGPIYMRESKADGSQAFALYWPRVPDSRRTETGGEDSVYWHGPDAHLGACARCHPTAGPAAKP